MESWPLDFWGTLLAILIAIAIGCAIWGIGIERYLFTIRVEQQRLAVLKPGSRSIRVLHISDIHMAPWQHRKQNFIAGLGQLDVDLVINTGDNLGHSRGVEPVLSALDVLLTKPGVFVNGSNDYYAPKPRNPFNYLLRPSTRESEVKLDTDALLAGFTDAGWLNLNNQAAALTVNGNRLRFVGVDDPHEHLDDLGSIAPNTAGLASDEVVIGVVHAPYLRVINAFAEADIELLFAGHTHGGQVCIPGYGALVTNCDLPTKAAKGLSVFSHAGKQIWLNVCAGLGHSIFAPVRFACRPEVRIIELVAKDL